MFPEEEFDMEVSFIPPAVQSWIERKYQYDKCFFFLTNKKALNFWRNITVVKKEIPVVYDGKLGSIIEVEELESGVKEKNELNDVAVAVQLGCVLAVE